MAPITTSREATPSMRIGPLGRPRRPGKWRKAAQKIGKWEIKVRTLIIVAQYNEYQSKIPHMFNRPHNMESKIFTRSLKKGMIFSFLSAMALGELWFGGINGRWSGVGGQQYCEHSRWRRRIGLC